VRRAEVVGAYRRRAETIEDMEFIIETDDFPYVVAALQRYGGRTPLVSSSKDSAVFSLSSGIHLRIKRASPKDWGLSLIECTGSKAHLRKLAAVTGSLKSLRTKGPLPTEEAFYDKFGLAFIEPELREGHDEVQRAAKGTLPVLVTVKDIRGELHAHSTSSDGSHSIEQMAAAAKEKGYEYTGITDHSQSLKIARGVPVEDLWEQIRYIDKLNERLKGFRVLKSSEVDILVDGSLDYPDELLKELDYTVCSIHSRFGLGKAAQT
jgi:DNA polymerase (family 10)